MKLFEKMLKNAYIVVEIRFFQMILNGVVFSEEKLL